MSVPKSVVKLDRNGVTYTSSVDRAAYTIVELTRAALRDVGRFVARQCNAAAMRLPGLGRSKRVRGKTSAFQYWVLKREGNLQVGIKHNTWYGVAQELGSAVNGGMGSGIKGQTGQKGTYGKKRQIPKFGILRNTVYNNIPKIVEIESKYLSALEDEAAALALIDSEDDYRGETDEQNN